MYITQSQQWIQLWGLNPLSAKLVLIQWDLWDPCYRQQTVARESQPSRSNDSTLLSAIRCQHEGRRPDLFWLVSINLRETKRGERAEDSLVYTWVRSDLTTGLYDMLYVVFSCTDKSLTSSFWSAHVDFSSVRGILFSSSWGSLDDLWASNKSPVTFHYCFYHLQHFTIFFHHSSPTVRSKAPLDPFSPWTLKARSESQDGCGLYATWAFCASLILWKYNCPISLLSSITLWLMQVRG